MTAVPRTMHKQRFERDGYLVVPGFVDRSFCIDVDGLVHDALDPLLGPAEFEADMGYPGAPTSRSVPGGNTPRRLLNAYSRFVPLREYATSAALTDQLVELFGRRDLLLSQNHHNCVMTKHPGYSTATSWHQDIRYWSFDRPELISAWLALDTETSHNGALRVIPGSHKLALDRGRFDADLFLRTDVVANRALIADAVTLDLAPGDLLLFHCCLFHAAGRNASENVKCASVFTYHSSDNQPIPGTRSAQYPGIRLNP